MKIAVIAASGRSGQAFVQQALAAGHDVVAGVHNNNPFEKHEGLTVMECEATSLDDVTQLIDRTDAVVSLIGHVKGSDDFVQTDAMKTITRAMDVAGVKRLVSLTGVGVWVPGDSFKRPIEILNKVSAKLGVKRFDDGVAHTKVLEESTLDWTVLRVLMLTNGSPGRFGLRAHGLPKAPTPRAEVARAILQVLEKKQFIREYPVMVWSSHNE